MHPAGFIAKALVNEELAPCHGAIGVEAFFADHMQLGAKEERGVRVNHEQRIAVYRITRRDGEAVGAAGLAVRHGDSLSNHVAVAVEVLQLP